MDLTEQVNTVFLFNLVQIVRAELLWVYGISLKNYQ